MLCRDSYWILKGLLVSQMNTTAENMCFNLLSLLKTYGHIPNGMCQCMKQPWLQ
jgi:alpha,alpha-trehalase